MLSLLIKHFKRILTLLIIGALLAITAYNNKTHAQEEYCRFSIQEQFCKYTVQEKVIDVMQQRQCEIVIRAGEYSNKPGKRIYLSDVDVRFRDIPTDIKIHTDSRGAYIHEHDINIKEARALVQQLKARGVNATLQVADTKAQDLNAAGRIANKSNPYIYVSIHHNYYDGNAQGYFAMYNPNDSQSKLIANRLSDSIANNGLVKQRESQANTGYIGELNALNKSTAGVLLELGFFSNGSELKNICSDKYVNQVSNKLADELTTILNEQYR